MVSERHAPRLLLFISFSTTNLVHILFLVNPFLSSEIGCHLTIAELSAKKQILQTAVASVDFLHGLLTWVAPEPWEIRTISILIVQIPGALTRMAVVSQMVAQGMYTFPPKFTTRRIPS